MAGSVPKAPRAMLAWTNRTQELPKYAEPVQAAGLPYPQSTQMPQCYNCLSTEHVFQECIKACPHCGKDGHRPVNCQYRTLKDGSKQLYVHKQGAGEDGTAKKRTRADRDEDVNMGNAQVVAPFVGGVGTEKKNKPREPKAKLETGKEKTSAGGVLRRLRDRRNRKRKRTDQYRPRSSRRR